VEVTDPLGLSLCTEYVVYKYTIVQMFSEKCYWIWFENTEHEEFIFPVSTDIFWEMLLNLIWKHRTYRIYLSSHVSLCSCCNIHSDEYFTFTQLTLFSIIAYILLPDLCWWQLTHLLYTPWETSQCYPCWNKRWCLTKQNCLPVQNGKSSLFICFFFVHWILHYAWWEICIFLHYCNCCH